jgi:hypothetical protein
MKKLTNIVFSRFYRYYGEDTGLVHSTILLASILGLIIGGIYIIVFKTVNEVGDPFSHLNTSSIKFRLVWGPLTVFAIQQVFYRVYKYKGRYKKINEYYEINKSTSFFSRNAHYLSFILSMIFFVSSFFIGDFINNVIYH